MKDSTHSSNLAKGARHSCRLNVNLSNTSEKQETSEPPKFKRPNSRHPLLMAIIRVQHGNPGWPQGDDYRPLNELADLEKENNYE